MEFESDFWHTSLKINGVYCEDIIHPKEDVYASLVPNSNGNLMVLIQRGQIYLYEVEPNTDIKAYVLQLTSPALPKWVKMFSGFVTIALVFFEIWYSTILEKKELWLGHGVIPLVVFVLIHMPSDYLLKNPSISLHRKRLWYFISLIVSVIFVILYNLIVLYVHL